MASKPSFPTALLRAYTSLFSRRTAQLQSHASRILGAQVQSQTQDAWRNHFDGVTKWTQQLGFGARKLQPIPIPVQPRAPFAQRRYISTEAPKSKIYSYEDIISILKTPTSSPLLIDVREPHEYAANTIPTAINIPVSSQPDALMLSEEDFEDRFGMPKPELDKEVVFFCKAGVRSRAMAGLARQAGYTNVGEYPGSWLDWERRGGGKTGV
ncbi:Rhodanese-like domain-containing protein [Paraphoma chrysanthemicola]|uniref:Rhodanese-like domain-containing protein n=1 Tax=Paraphoma chrysanthemicola TaxID=798071 RepID=A0A8K0R4G7_9PLEO|nr:Rhodanese-like domain-containing protein [Paraphoma chrysanthemicola]